MEGKEEDFILLVRKMIDQGKDELGRVAMILIPK